MSEQQSPNYEDLFYQSEDGLTLYARDYPAPSPDAQCVLLMHGLSRNSRDFEVLADHLSTRYRVLVAEQRGRGKSEWDTDPARYAISHYVRDMFALLQAANVRRVAISTTVSGGGSSPVVPGTITGESRSIISGGPSAKSSEVIAISERSSVVSTISGIGEWGGGSTVGSIERNTSEGRRVGSSEHNKIINL